jgi:hypothetical protein
MCPQGQRVGGKAQHLPVKMPAQIQGQHLGQHRLSLLPLRQTPRLPYVKFTQKGFKSTQIRPDFRALSNFSMITYFINFFILTEMNIEFL